jgi:hypothetical protein
MQYHAPRIRSAGKKMGFFVLMMMSHIEVTSHSKGPQPSTLNILFLNFAIPVETSNLHLSVIDVHY